MVFRPKGRKLKFPVSGSGQAKPKILLIEKCCFGRGQGISEFCETEGKGQDNVCFQLCFGQNLGICTIFYTILKGIVV
jgi:hypothetical protein